MKGGHPHLRRLRSGQFGYALGHLFGGLVGEGDGQYLPRRHAVLDQFGHAIGEHARLAAARAGEHEKRPPGGFHREALLGVEQCKVDHFSSSESFSKMSW